MRVEAARRPTGGQVWWGLAVFGIAVLLAAVIGGLAAQDSGQEYATLERPSFAPPQWLFGPVWTVLYVLIAIAGWLAWRRAGLTLAIWLFAAQLVLNALWTPLFFAMGAYGLAFAEIVVLWVVIGATVIAFHRISRAAAWLMVPYWAWVTYAAALNLAIWRLNT